MTPLRMSGFDIQTMLDREGLVGSRSRSTVLHALQRSKEAPKTTTKTLEAPTEIVGSRTRSEEVVKRTRGDAGFLVCRHQQCNIEPSCHGGDRAHRPQRTGGQVVVDHIAHAHAALFQQTSSLHVGGNLQRPDACKLLLSGRGQTIFPVRGVEIDFPVLLSVRASRAFAEMTDRSSCLVIEIRHIKRQPPGHQIRVVVGFVGHQEGQPAVGRSVQVLQVHQHLRHGLVDADLLSVSVVLPLHSFVGYIPEENHLGCIDAQMRVILSSSLSDGAVAPSGALAGPRPLRAVSHPTRGRKRLKRSGRDFEAQVQCTVPRACGFPSNVNEAVRRERAIKRKMRCPSRCLTYLRRRSSNATGAILPELMHSKARRRHCPEPDRPPESSTIAAVATTVFHPALLGSQDSELVGQLPLAQGHQQCVAGQKL